MLSFNFAIIYDNNVILAIFYENVSFGTYRQDPVTGASLHIALFLQDFIDANGSFLLFML